MWKVHVFPTFLVAATLLRVAIEPMAEPGLSGGDGRLVTPTEEAGRTRIGEEPTLGAMECRMVGF